MNYMYLQTLEYGTRIVRNDNVRGTYVKGSTLTPDLIVMDNGERITDFSDLSDYRTLDAATKEFFINKPSEEKLQRVKGIDGKEYLY